MDSLPRITGWAYRLQYSILWSLSSSNAGRDQKTFWSMVSLQWLLLPTTRERIETWPLQLMVLSQKPLTHIIYSYSCSTFQKPVSSHSLMYKREDKLCGVVSRSAVPCLLATNQILGHIQTSPQLTVLKYKIVSSRNQVITLIVKGHVHLLSSCCHQFLPVLNKLALNALSRSQASVYCHLECPTDREQINSLLRELRLC